MALCGPRRLSSSSLPPRGPLWRRPRWSPELCRRSLWCPETWVGKQSSCRRVCPVPAMQALVVAVPRLASRQAAPGAGVNERGTRLPSGLGSLARAASERVGKVRPAQSESQELSANIARNGPGARTRVPHWAARVWFLPRLFLAFRGAGNVIRSPDASRGCSPRAAPDRNRRPVRGRVTPVAGSLGPATKPGCAAPAAPRRRNGSRLLRASSRRCRSGRCARCRSESPAYVHAAKQGSGP